MDKIASSNILDDVREKIARQFHSTYAVAVKLSDKSWDVLQDSVKSWFLHEADEILALSGTTDIECPDCHGDGDQWVYGECETCNGTGKKKHPWKFAVVLENGELPKDELAELVIRQTEIVGMEGARHPYYQALQDMRDAGYVQEVKE